MPPSRPRTTETEISVSQEAWAGPLPDPESLREFNDVHPGASERIFRQWETESDHRRAMERESLQVTREAFNEDRRIQRRGQFFGWTVALSGLAAATALGLYGNAAAGVILGSVDLLGMVALFITGKRAEERSAETTAIEKVPPK